MYTLPLRTIMVAIDFGTVSSKTLEMGRGLADASGAALHLVHVIGHSMSDRGSECAAQSKACQRLDTLLDETDRSKRHVTTACLVGAVAPALSTYAAEHDVDLIVMGTHRHGPSFQMAKGSVAEMVLGMAPCAVLAVKEEGASIGDVLDPPSVVTSSL